jgi:hypothetical protein
MAAFPCDEEDVPLPVTAGNFQSESFDDVADIELHEDAPKALTGRRKKAAKQKTKQKPGSFGTMPAGVHLLRLCHFVHT